MKKKKNKKLKKQFRQMLQSQMLDHLKETEIEFSEKEKIPVLEEKKEEGKISLFVKKDIKRTVFISIFILSLMILLNVYLSYTHSSSQLSKILLKLIGAS